MIRFFLKIGIIAILFLGSFEKNISFSADLKKFKIEILPIASFVFAQREPMRVGWYNLQKFYKKKSFNNGISKPVGSLFVQLRPKKFEREYQLALRVLKDGSKQYKFIKEFTNGEKLHYKQYSQWRNHPNKPPRRLGNQMIMIAVSGGTFLPTC